MSRQIEAIHLSLQHLEIQRAGTAGPGPAFQRTNSISW